MTLATPMKDSFNLHGRARSPQRAVVRIAARSEIAPYLSTTLLLLAFILLPLALLADSTIPIRLQADAAIRQGIMVDLNTGTSPLWTVGDTVEFDIGLEQNGVFMTNWTNIQAITIAIYLAQNDTNPPQMLQTLTNFTAAWTNFADGSFSAINTNCSGAAWSNNPYSNLSPLGYATNFSARFIFPTNQTALQLNGASSSGFWIRLFTAGTNGRIVTYLEAPCTIQNGPTTPGPSPLPVFAVTTDSSGNLVAPASFFTVNSNLLNAAIWVEEGSNWLASLPGFGTPGKILSNNFTWQPSPTGGGGGSVLRPNTIFVEVNGSDANAGTNMGAPFLTLTNALHLAGLLGGSNVIQLGPGQFPIPEHTVVPANVTLLGQSQSATYITLINPTGDDAGYLYTEGDNITLKNFTLGTNTVNGTDWWPFVPSYGTNFLAENVTFIGDSDVIYCGVGDPWTNQFIGTFRRCDVNSGYDCVRQSYTSGSGALTNSFVAFIGCNFNIVEDAGFSQNIRGIAIDNGYWLVKDCVFNLLETANSTYAAAILVENNYSTLPPKMEVDGNVFNVTNTGSTHTSYGVYVHGIYNNAVLTVCGAINPTNVVNSGGIVNYDQIAASYTGIIPTGNVTNAAGFRVLYQNDGPNLTNLDASQLKSNTILVKILTNVMGTPYVYNTPWSNYTATEIASFGYGSGTVTSVTFTGDGIIDSATPSAAVTTSGTVAATALTQSANTVLAGPTSGSAAAPTFRAIVPSDVSASGITAGLQYVFSNSGSGLVLMPTYKGYWMELTASNATPQTGTEPYTNWTSAVSNTPASPVIFNAPALSTTANGSNIVTTVAGSITLDGATDASSVGAMAMFFFSNNVVVFSGTGYGAVGPTGTDREGAVTFSSITQAGDKWGFGASAITTTNRFFRVKYDTP